MPEIVRAAAGRCEWTGTMHQDGSGSKLTQDYRLSPLIATQSGPVDRRNRKRVCKTPVVRKRRKRKKKKEKKEKEKKKKKKRKQIDAGTTAVDLRSDTRKRVHK